MLKKLFILLIIIVLVCATLLVGVIYLVAEDTPRVARLTTPAESELAEIRNIIEENKPSNVLESNKKQLVLSKAQLNSLLAYGSARVNQRVNAHVRLAKDRFFLNTSITLPDNPVGKFINIQMTVRIQLSKYMAIENLKLGELKVPPAVIIILQPLIIDELNARYGEYVSLWRHLRRIDLVEQNVTVHYRLERADLAEIKNLGRKILVNSETRKKVIAYTQALDDILKQIPTESQSIINVLTPMFIFAQQQTKLSKNAPEENRMALLVLGAYMTGSNPLKYISEEPVKPFKQLSFTLNGRDDLTRHYLISAAINALSGSAWSNAIGLEKELNDADGGSGFSFVDLMADIAGNKLAQTALNKLTATALQDRMITLTDESQIIGRLAGLQEGLSEKEFRLEYGNTNSDEYISVVREIERRLFRCDVYRK